MKSRERFLKAFQKQSPDRVPIDYLAHPEIDRKLFSHYEVQTEEELLDKLGVDFYYLSCRDISQNESFLPYYKGPELYMDDNERICPFGIRYKRQAYESKFAVDVPLEGPLVDATTSQDILKHPWPRLEWFDFSPLIKESEEHRDRVIIGGLWTGILGDCYRMLGFKNFLMYMAMNPELIKTLVNRMTDFYLEMNDHIFQLLGDRLDIWFFGNDFGMQDGLLFSKDMFKEFFLPNIKKLTHHAHSYNLKVMMHSCGSVADLIPMLVDAGVEILDPIQVRAAKMDPQSLKSNFGGDMVFHGGIDTQKVLPDSGSDDVYQHAIETIDILGKNGGYIFAPSQILDPRIPLENIDAIYRAARDYRY